MERQDAINMDTKKAWEENWKPFEVEELMEIFTYPRVKKQLDLYLKYFSKNDKILEGGCGLGPYLIYLRKQGYNVVGVDYNEEPLKKIRQYDSSVPVSVMDVKKLSFPDGTFDGYLSLGVIEHFIEGPEGAIKEAYRVLKDNGTFIVQVPVMNIFLALTSPIELIKRNKLVRKLIGKKDKVYYWQCYFKKNHLKKILEDHGFSVAEIVPMDHEHSVISFCRVFRDTKSYDGANSAGLVLSRFCEKFFPWFTAANMVLVCKKETKGESA